MRVRAGRQQAAALGSGDRGEARGDIGPAGEDYPFDPGADRALRRPSVIAAIEDKAGTRLWHGVARGIDERLEPARPGIEPGIGRAQDDNRPAGFRRGGQCRDRVDQRVDDENGVLRLLLAQPACASSRFASSKVWTHLT